MDLKFSNRLERMDKRSSYHDVPHPNQSEEGARAAANSRVLK